MHELTIITDILETAKQAARENNLKKINKIYLKIGKLQQVVPEMLEFSFQVVSRDTIAQGAALKIETIPIKVNCKACLKETIVKENIYICPACDRTHLEILTGKELMITSIEGD